MKPYVIRQGDYLLKLSHLQGFDPEAVWNDGKNAQRKKLRKDPSMLEPGDILFVPDEPRPRLELRVKELNSFVARVPTVDVAVVVREEEEPLKNAKYVIEGLGDEVEQVTDAEGRVVVRAPVHVREVTVRFLEKDARMTLALGGLDPADTTSGVRMRLSGLGFYAAKTAGADRYVAHDEATFTAAVRAFQRAQGLEPTGVVDDATRRAIVEAHGS
jgi:hypothetical protein